MNHRAHSPSLEPASRTGAVPALVAALVFAAVTVVVSLWAGASTARACTQPEPVVACPVPPARAAEVPSEWRWDPPTTSFDDMYRSARDDAARR